MKKLYLSVCLAVLCVLHSFGQVPVLNSYPKAAAVIFLDFDGHYVAGTSWNWNGPFNCGPANLTQTQIREIFERVSEDYRPFNINVTTDSVRFLNAPYNQKTRVILTVTNEWYGSGAGGVASTGSFSRGDNTPCFVFTKLHNYRIKDIAEATSHEAGHTLGLRHQAVYDANCVKVSDYNSGTGTGELSWAAIMGVGYSRNMTTWHMGKSSLSCASIQSDLDIITGLKNNIGYRSDDHANAPVSASTITLAKDSLSFDGVIEQNSDLDYFKVDVAKTSLVHLEAAPYSVGANNAGSNLNVRVALFNAAQQEVGTFYSANKLDATIDTVLATGTYYLRVDGGDNSQYASSYGSLGFYSIKGAVSGMSVLPLRQLALQGKATATEHQLQWTVDADEQVVRQVLETSTDGIHFTAQKGLSAADRQWEQSTVATMHYRLRVQFDNGKEYYSNIILLRGYELPAARPRLRSTLVQGSSAGINSPVAYHYRISDLNGRVLAQGKASAGNNTVATTGLASGVYLARFVWDGGESVERFVKQ